MMDKIMSKTNDTSNVGYGAPKDHDALKEHRTLDDAELEVVSGGFFIDIGSSEALIVVTKPTDVASMNR